MAYKTPVKQTSQFNPLTSFTPEDIKFITDGGTPTIDGGVGATDVSGVNDGLQSAVDATNYLTDQSISLYRSKNALDTARLQTAFAFNVDDLKRAKEAGGNAITANAAQRGLDRSGIVKDDRAKFNEEVTAKELALNAGLQLDTADLSASLKILLNNMMVNGLIDVQSLTAEDLTWLQNQTNAFGGQTGSGEHPDGYAGDNGKMPPEALSFAANDYQGNPVQLTPSAAQQYQAMAAAAAKDGIYFNINNGYRTYEQQAALKANEANNSNPVASAGTSNHGLGLALDFQGLGDTARRWLYDNMAKYGWTHPLPSDPPHFTYIGGGVQYEGTGKASTDPTSGAVAQ